MGRAVDEVSAAIPRLGSAHVRRHRTAGEKEELPQSERPLHPAPLLRVGSMAARTASGIEPGPAVWQISRVRRELIGAHLSGSCEKPQDAAEKVEQQHQEKPRSFHYLRAG